MIPKNNSRAIVLIFIGMVLALWVYTNFDKNAGEIYLAMGIITLLAYRYSHELYNSGKEILIGIDDNIGTDILIGIAIGGGFVLLFESTSITMGLPPFYPQVTSGQIVSVIAAIVIVGGLAPILEEPLLRGAVLHFTDKLMPIIPAIVVTGVVFAMFHWVVYGSALVAAFVGAFLFSTVACIVSIRTKSLVSAVVTHAIINLYLLIQSEQLLTIGGF